MPSDKPRDNWFKLITPDVLALFGTSEPVPKGSIGVGEGKPLPTLPLEPDNTDTYARAQEQTGRKL